jgi:hypothetical protein
VPPQAVAAHGMKRDRLSMRQQYKRRQCCSDTTMVVCCNSPRMRTSCCKPSLSAAFTLGLRARRALSGLAAISSMHRVAEQREEAHACCRTACNVHIYCQLSVTCRLCCGP